MNNILTCNPRVVELIQQGSIPEAYLSKNYREVLENYANNFPASKFYFDRSGNIPHFLNVDGSAYPIPESDGFSMSFMEVVEHRCKELINTGKPINVSWSGGIDSTFVLFALNTFATDKSQIKVYGTYNSVVESGYMFDRFIKSNFEYDIHVSTSTNYKKPGEIFVTGSMGNDLFYPNGEKTRRDSWMMFKDPQCRLHEVLDEPYENHLREENLIFLEPLLKNPPKKIETLQDLRWVIDFCFNWYSTRSNSYVGLDKTICDNIYSFFGSDNFQRWALTNTDVRTKTGDYTDERWQLREFIAEATGDNFYPIHKKNFTSVLSLFDPDWVFLLNDYSNIYLSDLQH